MEETSRLLKDRIESAQARSLAYLDAVRRDPADLEAVRDNLTTFVLCRLFLVDEKPGTDDLMALAKMSADKLAKASRRGELQAFSNNCAGVSSETLKKALLIMTLQKQLGITFDPLQNDTVAQLAQAVVEKLGGAHGRS